VRRREGKAAIKQGRTGTPNRPGVTWRKKPGKQNAHPLKLTEVGCDRRSGGDAWVEKKTERGEMGEV